MNHASKKISGASALAIAIVLIHFGVNIAHGSAHRSLEIGLSGAQRIFVLVVILAAPVVSAVLIWKQRVRIGGALLAISMAGALGFGIYFHFVLAGPDNIAQRVPAAMKQSHELFVETAYGLAIAEVLGVIFGAILFLRSAANREGAAASNRNVKVS